MVYWIHIARQIDRAMLHRERCAEVPSNNTSSDFWEGAWIDYPDKERAVDALEDSPMTYKRMCPLCKP